MAGANGAWLGWSHGEIWTKNPSDELIRYMITIAPKFNARVRGDEGEFYRTTEDVYFEKEGREVPWQEREQKRMAKVTRHKRKRFYANCVRVIILLIVAYFFIRKHLL